MIPILYQNTEKEFKSNGIGRLSEAITCRVTEERNGIFELEMTYPITGKLFKDIVPTAHIKAKNVNKISPQVFSIYKVGKPINGIVTVYARHISYRLSYIPTSQFKASSASSALAGLKDHAAEDCPFEFWTDKVTDGDFSVEVPSSIRSKLGGSSGSILDVYGGEYEFDNFLVKLHAQRGQDTGVTLRYGKNITDIKQEENIESTITGVYPYWLNFDGEYMELPEKVVHAENASNFPHKRTVPLDCTGDFNEKPTEEQLRTRAETYLKDNNAGKPKVSITVSFVALWQTEEYKEIAPLEKVNLCDTVSVEFLKLNISAKAKVVKTVYNVLLDRYDSIEIGEPTSNLATNIIKQNEEIAEKPAKSFVEKAAANATNWITGVDGGSVVVHKDADNKPYELLIMDTEDISTATNVWRYNKNGWGFSNTGYYGTYSLAATLDGGIVADSITTGRLNANLIKVGVISDVSGKNVWDLEKGLLSMKNGTISVSGQVVFKAEDYTEDDATIVQELIVGTREMTAEYMQKYDFTGKGYVDGLDLLKVRRLLLGAETQYTLDLSIVINALTQNSILRTGAVLIGMNGLYSKNISSDMINFKQLSTTNESGVPVTGDSGSFTTADGKTVNVSNGIITGIV